MHCHYSFLLVTHFVNVFPVSVLSDGPRLGFVGYLLERVALSRALFFTSEPRVMQTTRYKCVLLQTNLVDSQMCVCVCVVCV